MTHQGAVVDDGVCLACDAHPCSAVEPETRSVQVTPDDFEPPALDPLLVPDTAAHS